MEEKGANLVMICTIMCFARVVREDFFARVVLERNKFLCLAVEQPEITHFHASRFLLFHGVVYYADTVVELSM